MRRRGIGVGAASLAATCAIVAAGCGGSSGPVELTYLGAIDSNHTNSKAAKECSDQSNGQYVIKQTPVSTSADASRELIVRRLAAGDKHIDIVSMDTIWTPEFAEAGWLRELTGQEKTEALDDVLDGPKASVTWKNYRVFSATSSRVLAFRRGFVQKTRLFMAGDRLIWSSRGSLETSLPNSAVSRLAIRFEIGAYR